MNSKTMAQENIKPFSKFDEDCVRVIFDHLGDEFNCTHVLISLATSLVNLRHQEQNCSLFNTTLQTLEVVLRVQKDFSLKTDNYDDALAACKSICDICVHTLKEIHNGKDRCIPLLCDVLCYSLPLLDSDSLYKKLKLILQESSEEMQYIIETTCITYDERSTLSQDMMKISLNLRIIESIIVGLSNKRSKSQKYEAIVHSHFISLFDNELLDLLVKLTGRGHEVLTAQILLCVIPKLVILTGNKSVLEQLWNQIACMFHSIERNKIGSQIFLILCMLADFFIPCNQDSAYIFNVVQTMTFWEILQYGLPSEEPLMRKQALYLLKRAVDNEAHISLTFSTSDTVFWWNSEKSSSFREAWNNLFLLLEVLEEKQMHLIKPVEPVLYHLKEACKEGVLHYSWILCIIQRALRHECNAVMRWGVTCLINVDLSLYAVPNEDYLCLTSSLMKALNNTSLYVKNKFSDTPDFIDGLKTYFTSLANCSRDVSSKFFSALLQSLLGVPWGPVSLFYVIFSLSSVPKTPVWNSNDISLLKSFLVDTLATQIVYIRGAIQSFSIEVLIHLSDDTQLDVWTVADILGTFRRKESLKRGTQVWSNTAMWLKSCFTHEEAINFSHCCVETVLNGDELKCDVRSIVRMILLLADAHLISFNTNILGDKYSLHSDLLSVVECFENCNSRLYMSGTKQDACFEMLILLMDESGQEEVESDPIMKYIATLMQKILPGLFHCIKKKMFSVCDLQCYSSVNLYVNSLHLLCNEFIQHLSFLKEVEVVQDSSLSLVKDESDNVKPMAKYCAIKILLWISEFITSTSSRSDINFNIKSSVLYSRQMEFVEDMCASHILNKPLMKDKHNENFTRDLKSQWGKIVSEHLHAKWSMLNAALELLGSAASIYVNCAGVIFRDATEALEIGGRGVLVPVMSVMQKILPQFIADKLEDVIRFMSMCWTGIFELRKSDLFWISFEKFIGMSFQEDIMHNRKMQELLLTYAKRIFALGETVTGLSNILMVQLKTVALHGNLWALDSFVDVIVDALLFGTVHRRDQKIDYETCEFIRSLGEKCSVNKICIGTGSETEVRVLGIQLLLILQDSTSCDGILTNLARKLIEKDKEASLRKTRYFADSYHHRFKNRIMQALLLLEASLCEEECWNLISYLKESLLSDNHQPSIRYFQEWLLVRLLVKNKIQDHVWTMLLVASERRPGSVCSFIAIIYHIARVLPQGNELQVFVERALEEILPWSMAQHFSIRLYAQVVVFKLWEFAVEASLSDTVEKYRVMYTCVKASLSTAGSSKNARKFLDDFFFTSFNSLRHYSLKTIYWDLPRLANVTSEEWISIDMFEAVGLQSSLIPLCSEDSMLHNFDCLFVAKPSSGGCEEDMIQGLSNVQKKIIPWKAMIPDPELLLSVSESVLRRKQTLDDGLIVVASLIDRPPNLGGLSRTCEVFGVSQYILDNVKVLEDKQFQTLSVSAERWISIFEVKCSELPEYLKAMKGRGYTVVGAEQTASSIQLQGVKFPKKTVLLLGNEKEGIPVDLLPLMDVCVEVPQQGVVRSLNVHVTGAIFIWEYARQHSIK